MIYEVSSEWRWKQSNLVLRRKTNTKPETMVYQSIAPDLSIKAPDCDKHAQELDILMDPWENFDTQLGFCWHKSWYIPCIVASIDPKCAQFLAEKAKGQLKFEITSAFPCREQESYYMEEIPLEGSCKKAPSSDEYSVEFFNLKFSQTSFSNNRNRFCLIIICYIEEPNTQKKMTVSSYISPPIYVDSRREARKKVPSNNLLLKKVTAQQFLQPLTSLNKRKLKMKNRLDFLQHADIIDKFEGFVNYYSAANIRYKVKHPYYIGYHFHYTFDVFYSREYCSSAEEAIFRLEGEMGVHSSKIIMFYIKNHSLNQPSLSKSGKPKKIKKNTKKLNNQIFFNRKKTLQEEDADYSDGEVARRKLTDIFEYWKFFFIECNSEQEISRSMIKSKWIHIPRKELFEVYCRYSSQQIKAEQQQDPEVENSALTKRFEYSQVIVLNQGRYIKSTRSTKDSGNKNSSGENGNKQDEMKPEVKIQGPEWFATDETLNGKRYNQKMEQMNLREEEKEWSEMKRDSGFRNSSNSSSQKSNSNPKVVLKKQQKKQQGLQNRYPPSQFAKQKDQYFEAEP